MGRVSLPPSANAASLGSQLFTTMNKLVRSNLRQKLRITLNQVLELSILATVLTADDSVAGPRGLTRSCH
jgi:hypothetical protein